MQYISLLKGINVGGHKIIKMNDLKALYESLSYQNVITYIQSGNVIFETNIEDMTLISKEIEAKIIEKYGFEVSIILITLENLKKILQENPFTEQKETEIKQVYIGFTKSNIAEEYIQNAEFDKYTPDKCIIKENCVYIFYPNGAGKSKLNNDTFEKKLKTIITIRNLNTLEKIVELSELK